MISILSFLFTITLLVTIHELGHYYVAKKFGVKIEEFSIGFGKTLLSTTDKQGVKWKISLLPFGGFVKMYNATSERLVGDKNNAAIPSQSYNHKPEWVKILIILAGPLANFFLAILIFFILNLSFGQPFLPPIIADITEGSPAYNSGLQVNDKVLEIDQKVINKFSELRNIVSSSQNKELTFKILRDDREIFINVFPEPLLENGKVKVKNYLGVTSTDQFVFQKLNIFSSALNALTEMLNISYSIMFSITKIVTGQNTVEGLMGPIGIANEAGNMVSKGPFAFGIYLALLSINLGVFNLLPIPGLDGGKLLIHGFQALTGRMVSDKFTNIISIIGFIFIIFMIVISTSNDIKSLLF